MEITVNNSVGEVVRANYNTARVFEKFKIDYCCGGEISIKEACNREKVDPDALLSQLEETMLHVNRNSRYLENLPPSGLCDYIVEIHHSYINETAPFLRQKLRKLCEVHGEHHPELFKVQEMFNEAAGNLATHMKKEELVLFPYIHKMVDLKSNGKYITDEPGSILSPIRAMLEEHQAEGDRFKTLSELTHQYRVPADGCNTYQITYKSLAEFESDLHRHIHLENNVLFPKSIELEKELTGKKI